MAKTVQELATMLSQLEGYTIFLHNANPEYVGKTEETFKNGLVLTSGEKGMQSKAICLGQASEIRKRAEELIYRFHSSSNIIVATPNNILDGGISVPFTRHDFDLATAGKNYQIEDLLDEYISSERGIPAEFIYGTYELDDDNGVNNMNINPDHYISSDAKQKDEFRTKVEEEIRQYKLIKRIAVMDSIDSLMKLKKLYTQYGRQVGYEDRAIEERIAQLAIKSKVEEAEFGGEN